MLRSRISSESRICGIIDFHNFDLYRLESPFGVGIRCALKRLEYVLRMDVAESRAVIDAVEIIGIGVVEAMDFLDLGVGLRVVAIVTEGSEVIGSIRPEATDDGQLMVHRGSSVTLVEIRFDSGMDPRVGVIGGGGSGEGDGGSSGAGPLVVGSSRRRGNLPTIQHFAFLQHFRFLFDLEFRVIILDGAQINLTILRIILIDFVLVSEPGNATIFHLSIVQRRVFGAAILDRFGPRRLAWICQCVQTRFILAAGLRTGQSLGFVARINATTGSLHH